MTAEPRRSQRVQSLPGTAERTKAAPKMRDRGAPRWTKYPAGISAW